ncbi:MAG TPA: hypothetical protein VF551_06530, partial [Chthoniobacterales bacterium]
LITAWIVVQIATTVLPAFSVPRWVLAALVILLALGVPLVLVLGWIFDLAPSGLTKAPDRAETTPGEKARNTRLLALTAVALTCLFLVGHWGLQKWRGSSGRTATAGARTLAVLPFENLSQEKENTYFASGIQEEILTRLIKIGALKVISRASTAQYASQPTNLSEIARQLGVTHVLEGTVQKAGDQVRINVQLINAETDTHVWAESFDRKLIDLFGVESEVAEKIASALQARLTGEEHQALAVTPTKSVAAYDYFLRGLAYERTAAVAPDTFQNAVRAYEQAVEADPNFAVAWAHMAVMHSAMYHFGFDHTPGRLASMQRAAETAMRLQPNLAEAHLAWGFYQYRGTQDYPAAEKAFDEARQRSPSDPAALSASAFVKRRQAKWNEALALLEKVAQLDPRNAQLHSEWGYSLLFTRHFAQARQVAERGLSIAPNDSTLCSLLATIAQGEGDLARARRAIASLPLESTNATVFTTQMSQLLFERQFAQVIAALSATLQFPDASLGGQIGEYYVILSRAQRAAGDELGARATCDNGIRFLEEMRANRADTWFLSGCLGLLHAGRGDAAAALREGEHALSLTGPDVSAKPDVEEAIARMNAELGRADAAIDALPRLLQASYQKSFFGAVLTPALLKIDPAWDRLRSDPRFLKLSEPAAP